MKRILIFLVVIVLFGIGFVLVRGVLVTSTSFNTTQTSSVYIIKNDPSKGNYMADPNGMTLYTYSKDIANKSNCNNNCLAVWPAYFINATDKPSYPANINVIARPDGSKQFTWKGMPLYYYTQDKTAGDIKGDGVGGLWHIIKL